MGPGAVRRPELCSSPAPPATPAVTLAPARLRPTRLRHRLLAAWHGRYGIDYREPQHGELRALIVAAMTGRMVELARAGWSELAAAHTDTATPHHRM